ncbi:hypothetical protein BB561_005562 [Smittium simulii]|uniref:Zinc finger CHCC-type domain-containing protein n=1 Tax=Smittium simulii TaxID=133385 RepID=A0A2T9Y9R1_9FUNG|nr:hypothetical protein BB561_005562 [Smittium simulii]
MLRATTIRNGFLDCSASLKPKIIQSARFTATTFASKEPYLPSPYKNEPNARDLAQSLNRDTTWSESQKPRELAMSGPRFTQTNLKFQPQSMSAIELIAEQPIRLVNGRKAFCDGGMGAMGHPKVYMNLDKPHVHSTCVYCGLRFMQNPEHNSHH